MISELERLHSNNVHYRCIVVTLYIYDRDNSVYVKGSQHCLQLCKTLRKMAVTIFFLLLVKYSDNKPEFTLVYNTDYQILKKTEMVS